MGTGQESDGTILQPTAGGRMRLDLRLLADISRRPRLYSGRDRLFWADPYVSEHVLWAHLNPDNDDASRRPARIDASVEFLLRKLEETRTEGPGENLGDGGRRAADFRVLDLGCGPGLYAERLADAGCAVTGIDLSPASIAYACEKASRRKLPATYRCEDIHVAELNGPYDLVLLIYGEFCTFTPAEQRSLLARVHSALAPGGLFVMDVFTRRYVDRIRRGNDWYVRERDGFWHGDAHLVLEQTFRYPSDSASVVRYTIVDGDGGFRQFSVWWRHFTTSEITALVEPAGFSDISLYGSVWGSPLRKDTEWIAVTCRRA